MSLPVSCPPAESGGTGGTPSPVGGYSSSEASSGGPFCSEAGSAPSGGSFSNGNYAAYDPAGYPIAARLLEDGRRWSILPGPVAIAAPVRILQGGADDAVPWRHALDLAEALESRDVVFTLIKDGDHRLSRPQDLARLVTAVEEISE